MLLRTYIHRYVHTKVLRLLRFNPIKGRSLMAHIRRTRHIMMPSHLIFSICFSKQTIQHGSLNRVVLSV